MERTVQYCMHSEFLESSNKISNRLVQYCLSDVNNTALYLYCLGRPRDHLRVTSFALLLVARHYVLDLVHKAAFRRPTTNWRILVVLHWRVWVSFAI